MIAIELVIDLPPHAAPRARIVTRATGKGNCKVCKRPAGLIAQHYTSPQSARWRQAFGALVRTQMMRERLMMFETPIGVAMQFVEGRPERMTWRLRPMPRLAKGTKPDIDNYAVAVMNSLNGVVWQDDALVTDVVMAKRYAAGAETAHVRLRIEALPLSTDFWTTICRWDTESETKQHPAPKQTAKEFT